MDLISLNDYKLRVEHIEIPFGDYFIGGDPKTVQLRKWLNISEDGVQRFWNGYVSVPPGHLLFGMTYNDAHEAAEIEVHGGLTYAGAASFDEGGDWWFGFDTAHAMDYENPKSKQYVQVEAESLRQQFWRIGNGN